MIQNNHFSSFSVGKKEFFSRNDMTCCREKLTVKVSERQLAAANRLVYHRCAKQLLQVIDMVYKVVEAFNILYLFAPCLAHLTKRLILLKTGKPSTAQVGGNARCGAAAEGVKNPIALVGRGKDHPDEQAQGLMGGVLAAGLLPFAFVNTHHLAALQRYSAVGEKIRRIGKNHVKLEFKAKNGIVPFFVSDCLYLSEKHVIFVASLFLFLNLINENR